MLSSFAGLFIRDSSYSHEKEEHKEPNNVENFVFRDELNKNPPSSSTTRTTSKPKKGKKVSFSSTVKPEQLGAGGKGGNNLERLRTRRRRSHASSGSISSSVEEGGVVRVTVRMTKAEAARLLAKCQDGGGVLGFKDVADELTRIPMDRVDVACPGAALASVLDSISEEF